MPARWSVRNWPECRYHVFLSHCAEDRDTLVLPVFQELARLGYSPWIDRHHYPAGRDPVDALFEEIAASRHIVYFITPAMLRQGRGWPIVERTVASLQSPLLKVGNLDLCHLELPLLFAASDNVVLPRSVWNSLVPRAARYSGSPRSRSKQVEWSVATIVSFLIREESWAAGVAECVEEHPDLQAVLDADENLRNRILVATPPGPLGPLS